MLKEYTQGFIVPQAFTSEYRGEYGEPRKFDAVVMRDGVILEMIGVNMPTDFLSELKRLIDAELTKRRALETENEDTQSCCLRGAVRLRRVAFEDGARAACHPRAR